MAAKGTITTQRVIKGTKILAKTKESKSRDKDHIWKTDKQDMYKEHKVTTIIHAR